MKRNPWKTAFLTLAAAITAVLVLLAFFLFVPDGKVPKEQANNQKIQFHVAADKADLTAMINRYLKQEDMQGEVALNRNVVFYGHVGVFSQKMRYSMTFQPRALKNGDLLLKQKSVSLGSIHLPVSYILKFVKTTYNLPDWVIIQPSEKQVYVQLSKMRLNNGARVKADRFDLPNNHIVFTLSFPNQ
ncbi:YpmS family protein [Heyndrickxia acidiproducens]|uniref:YpmS family protein n=1 Tax=Heyndrickxia acidiproducens TaxID=1121084 RepID=UPI000373BEC1|nr:YpmS family protein [Heyndrickxia acidiproducens]